MGFLDSATNGSIFNGYKYYKTGKVLKQTKISNTEFSGVVSGHYAANYDVFIDIDHPNLSHCSCLEMTDPLIGYKNISGIVSIRLHFIFQSVQKR